MKRLCVLLFFLGYLKGDESDFQRLDQIKVEPECSRAGGMCVPAPECPAGHFTQKQGLCPKQLWMNIECCYGMSIKETRCAKRGGSCVKNNTCIPLLTFKEATDCAPGQTCCILVN